MQLIERGLLALDEPIERILCVPKRLCGAYAYCITHLRHG